MKNKYILSLIVLLSLIGDLLPHDFGEGWGGVYAQTNTAIATGFWSSTNTWSLGHTPIPGEDIVIPAGATVTLDANVTLIHPNIAVSRYFKVDGDLILNGKNLYLQNLSQTNPFRFICNDSIVGSGLESISIVSYSDVYLNGIGSILNLGNGGLTITTVIVAGFGKTVYVGGSPYLPCSPTFVAADAVPTNLKVDGNINIKHGYAGGSSSDFKNFGKLTINGTLAFSNTVASGPGVFCYNYPSAEIIINNGNLAFSGDPIYGIVSAHLRNSGKIEINGDLILKKRSTSAMYVYNGLISELPDTASCTTLSSVYLPGTLTVIGDIKGLGVSPLFTSSSVNIVNYKNSIFNLTDTYVPGPDIDLWNLQTNDTNQVLILSYFNNTVNYIGTSILGQSIKPPRNNTYWNLQCSESYTKTLPSNLKLLGNLTLQDSAQLDVTASSYSISIAGSWINNSTKSFVERNGIVKFTGNTTQTITASVIGKETFHELRIEKSNKDSLVVLTDNISVSDTLKLTKGGLSLNSDTLFILSAAKGIIARDSGYIKSEMPSPPGYGVVDWKVKDSVGVYQFPFAKSSSASDFVPVTFSITVAGDTTSHISVATYGTIPANTPLPLGVTNITKNGMDNSANVVDRFWIINSTSLTTQPILTFTLSTTAAEASGISNLQAQRWNSAASLWEFPLPSQTNSANSAALHNFNLPATSPWTLVNNNSLLSEKPIVTHSSNITVCSKANNPIKLITSSSNGVAYSWSPITSLTDTSGLFIVNPSIPNAYYNGILGYTTVIALPTITTTFTLIASNNSGIDTSFITVYVSENPTAVILNSNSTICIGAEFQLLSKGGGDYYWTPSNGLANATIFNPIASPTISTTYTLTVRNAQGCEGMDAFTISVKEALVANAGNDLTICSGVSSVLNTTITNGSNIVWNPSIALNSNSISSPIINASTSQTITYTITVSSIGCNDISDYITVQVLQSPLLIASNVSICIGTTPTLTVNGADSYIWSNNSTSLSIFPIIDVTSTYTIIGTNSNGCVDTSVVKATLNPLPNVDAGSNITASTAAEWRLNGSGASDYLWSPTTNLSPNDVANPLITNRISQQYNLIGTDANGCVNTDSVYVKYIVCDEVFVPDAFSPNSDNQNDMLDVVVEDSECIQNMNLQIYDRWGTMVFETDDATKGWDGKYKGQELTDAVFVYRIDIINVDKKEITQKGNISLIK